MEAQIIYWLKRLDFTPKNNAGNNIYSKKYRDDEILVDVSRKTIDYTNQDKNKKIFIGYKHSTNFSHPEYFVVLECVDRILTLSGCDLKSIKIENDQPDARADITVSLNLNDEVKRFIIECKTYGEEFEKELKQMKKNGGKAQEYNKKTGYTASMLILYASSPEAKEGKRFTHQEAIFKVNKDKATYDVDTTFEDLINSPKDETTDKLTKLDDQQCDFIFETFRGILRRYAISDQSNAFNKLITLILCKLEAELEKKNNTESKYSFKSGNIKDLLNLYEKGMENIVGEKVDYHSKDKTGAYVFSFKEVYNDKTFTKNNKVVVDVVNLLKGYQFLYDQENESLSYLFEKLLTTGLKQESGQFFTPVIIVRFILKSLPIEDLLKKKRSNHASSDDLVPKIIDPAAGSGHFLIESIREIKRMVEQLDNKGAYVSFGKGGENRDFINKIRTNKDGWESKCIFGIEKDDRLAKVAKIGCALRQNKKVTLINSDGLAYFNHPDVKDYFGEGKFDIVVSNPPFSVKGFNQDNEHYNKKAFTLSPGEGDDIECLFVERIKQLLTKDGIAGIILPRSILNTEFKIHIDTRKIILQYFKIIAIMELRGGYLWVPMFLPFFFFLKEEMMKSEKK